MSLNPAIERSHWSTRSRPGSQPVPGRGGSARTTISRYSARRVTGERAHGCDPGRRTAGPCRGRAGRARRCRGRQRRRRGPLRVVRRAGWIRTSPGRPPAPRPVRVRRRRLPGSEDGGVPLVPLGLAQLLQGGFAGRRRLIGRPESGDDNATINGTQSHPPNTGLQRSRNIGHAPPLATDQVIGGRACRRGRPCRHVRSRISARGTGRPGATRGRC
jgi:hypothetical protein